MFKKIAIVLFFTLAVLTSEGLAEGKKMGLFVGINEYTGEISPLRSCVNDAKAMQEKLSRSYGFEASNMSSLYDAQATRANILNKLSYYERESSRGDLFVFYYSGHGAVYPDALSHDRDETQQITFPGSNTSGYYDSTLIPIDADSTSSDKPWGNMILDDELNEIFSKFTAKGVEVIFISDSCNSGTLAKNLNLDDDTFSKFVSPKALGFDISQWQKAAKTKGKESNNNFNKLFLVIGSSQDNQTSSAINPETGWRMSLFTFVFLKVLQNHEAANKKLSYRKLDEVVSTNVKNISEGEQIPRLDARFYEPAMLDKPIFSLKGGGIRIVIKVTDGNGNPIEKASFAVLPLNANTSKEGLTKSDLLIFGRTNKKGLFDSGANTLEPGKYKVKVVKEGYQAFVDNMEVVPKENNTLVFIFKLVRE